MTERTRHMGYTFRLWAGGVDAVEGVFGDAGAQTKSMGQKHGTKRSRETGEFMDQKKTGKFKSVRREKG